MALCFVLTAADPRDGSVRYVGTTRDPSARLRGLLSKARKGTTARDLWIAELLKLGMQPVVETHATFDDDVLDRVMEEERWAAIFRNMGEPILNGQGYAKLGPKGDEAIVAAIRTIIEHRPDASRAQVSQALFEMGFKTASGRPVARSHVAHLRKRISDEVL